MIHAITEMNVKFFLLGLVVGMLGTMVIALMNLYLPSLCNRCGAGATFRLPTKEEMKEWKKYGGSDL